MHGAYVNEATPNTWDVNRSGGAGGTSLGLIGRLVSRPLGGHLRSRDPNR